MRSAVGSTRTALVSSVSILGLLAAVPASAQTTTTTPGAAAERPSGPAAPAVAAGGGASSYSELDEIIVTAQRQAQSLQDVPISVSAFTSQALEAKQINNSSDLQLSLPNVTFTKANFTTANFTIRGVGDSCVGFSCDTATGIHVNDMPLVSTRLFETEYLDLERVEVLRGPQGTLFGRNATSGVVNVITARPDLAKIGASADGEYGNFESYRANAMFNLPIGDKLGIRVAGNYLKRDGFTRNLFDGGRVDDRDQYSVRGTLRFRPTDATTLDLIAYYFREDDNRSRIQKQLCNRDPTAVLGCAPDRLENETTNGNATLSGVLTSREFISVALSPALAGFGLGSVYGQDVYAGTVNPSDLRTVNTDYRPTYFAEEEQYQGRLEQRLGDSFKLTVTGGYTRNVVDSRVDYSLAVADPYAANPIALGALNLLNAAKLVPPPLPALAAFRNFSNAIIPTGPGAVCVSQPTRQFVGIFGGQTERCAANQTEFDRSSTVATQYSVEGHVDSDFEGPFNFLVGGIYLRNKQTGDYFVNATGLDYAAGVVGAAATAGATFNASPYFDSLTDNYRLKSYGIFGEAYFEATDRLKLTVGLRYSNDRKQIQDRNFLLNPGLFAPYGTTDLLTSPALAGADFDPSTPTAANGGVNEPFRSARVKYGRLTGRAVVDYKLNDDSLLYASYSRGYKSGGINPPFDANQFSAPTTFSPETIDAFEIGTKNTFAGGSVRLNASAFYYKYKDLQISRILARTSFNDNTNATIYGAEVEAIVAPIPPLVFNIQFSYLKTKIKDLNLVDTRDPSGGRSDTVIIKDLTNASNCVVTPTGTGTALQANTFVAAFNSALGLRPPTPIPGTNTTGAFSVCSALASAIQTPPPALRALLGTPAGPLPFAFRTNAAGVANGLPDGIALDLSGNRLPNAPEFKVGVGGQYTFEFTNGMTLVPRVDFNFTGETFSRSFNQPIDRIRSFEQLDAQLTLNGPDSRWFVRGFVQNLQDNDSVTGQYVTDPSSGLFTNIFTLEPRRYGIGAGIKF